MKTSVAEQGPGYISNAAVQSIDDDEGFLRNALLPSMHLSHFPPLPFVVLLLAVGLLSAAHRPP